MAPQIWCPNMELGDEKVWAHQLPPGEPQITAGRWNPSSSKREKTILCLSLHPFSQVTMKGISWVWPSEGCQQSQPASNWGRRAAYTQLTADAAAGGETLQDFSLEPTSLSLNEGPQKSQVFVYASLTADKTKIWWITWGAACGVGSRPLTGEWISQPPQRHLLGAPRNFDNPQGLDSSSSNYADATKGSQPIIDIFKDGRYG